MGLTHVSVLIRSVGSTNGGGYVDQFLVDTGAIDSLAPSSELIRAGIKPAGTVVYELADGAEQEFTVGAAEIEVLGVVTYGRSGHTYAETPPRPSAQVIRNSLLTYNRGMGLTHVDVALMQLIGANGRYEARFLVDSGATDTMVPASELARLGSH